MPRPVSWGALLVLGITGGLIPCWDAVFILIYTVGRNALWMTLPLLLAFSAGLATVLILIGVLVVYLKGTATARWGEGRLIRALPLVSAALIMGLGLWLCYDTVQRHEKRGRSSRVARPESSKDVPAATTPFVDSGRATQDSKGVPSTATPFADSGRATSKWWSS